jgi:multidrug efflux pump
VISAVVSLTLTPMMCARLLHHRSEAERGTFYRQSQRMFDQAIDAYGRTLRWVLNHQSATLAVAATTLAFTILLYVVVPKGFFPVQDTGAILGISEASQSVSFAAMVERQQALTKVILADPAVSSLSSFIGVDGTNTTLNSGRIYINLKPFAERRNSAQDVIVRLQRAVADVDGIALFLQPLQDLTVEDRVSRTQYQYTLEDADPEELGRWAPTFVEALQALPELRDVGSDQQDRGLASLLLIDRSTASRLGITPQLIVDTLYDAFGQRQVSTMFTQLNQYRVVLEVMPEFQSGPQALQFLDLRSSTGGQVPLSVFTRFSETTTPLAISRQGQFPAVTLSFNLAPGVSLGDAVTAIEQAALAIGLPPSIRGSFQGTALAFQASLGNETWLILAALVTVYIVLGILYESYIHPLTILSTLPSAGVGALLALMLFRTDFSVIALIAMILLIGIVKKNAIMMIDFALDAERKEGKPPTEAVYEACLLRFRPIMMTTMAALLGALPLAVGTGVGSELRHPLGIAIIGGLVLSQILTLYTTPVVYLAFDRLARRFKASSPHNAVLTPGA